MFYNVKKILYASDFNKGSHLAFRAAVSLCGHYPDSQITCLNVIRPLSGTNRSVLSNSMDREELDEMLRKGIETSRVEIRDRIERFCADELEEHEVLSLKNIDIRVEEGTPWRKILDIADKIDADVIVMGTRKHNALEKMLIVVVN